MGVEMVERIGCEMGLSQAEKGRASMGKMRVELEMKVKAVEGEA